MSYPGNENNSKYHIVCKFLCSCLVQTVTHCLSPLFPLLCTVVFCGNPGVPPHSIQSGSSFTFRQYVKYSCSRGYLLVGSSILTCQADRRWDKALPKCTPVSCPRLIAPSYGTINSSSVTFPSAVKFQCIPGFILTGMSTLSCTADKKWSHSPPKCSPVQCPHLKTRTGSQIVRQNSSFLGEVVSQCVSGFKHSAGNEKRVCQSLGKWSGKEFVCEGKACSTPMLSFRREKRKRERERERE